MLKGAKIPMSIIDDPITNELEVLCKQCAEKTNNRFLFHTKAIMKILNREGIFTTEELWAAGYDKVKHFKGVGDVRWSILFKMLTEIRYARREEKNKVKKDKAVGKITRLKDVDTKTAEGRLLMAAIAYLSTTMHADKTPEEILVIIYKTSKGMF